MSEANVPELEARVRSEIERLTDDLIELRRYFHANPELSFEEYRTTRRLSELLDEWGVPHRVLARGVGIVGEVRPIRTDADTPKVALRADIDALAIEEQNDVPYRSQTAGVMHACGHDAHMACLLGAVRALSSVRDELPGNVRFFFQPGEEVVPGGALDIIEAGGLDGVDEVYGLHVAPELDLGSIGIKSGAFTASADRFDIRVIGRSGHGARPHQAVDPIFVGLRIVDALYHAMRLFDPREAAVLTVGRFRGGYSPNVIPETTEIAGTFRSTDHETRGAIAALLERTVRDVCAMYGATGELELSHGPPAVVNDEICTDVVDRVASAVLGQDRVLRIAQPSMGSEDFAEYLVRKRGAMFRLGVGGERERYGLHSAYFDLEERAIPIGAQLLALCAVRRS